MTVGPPKLGEMKPAFVMADVTFNIGKCTESVQREWDSLRPHDSLFLLSIQRSAGQEFAEIPDSKLDSIQIMQKYGVKLVRGGTINALIGDNGRPLEEYHTADAANALLISKKLQPDPEPSRHQVNAGRRTYRLLLDTNQYVHDIAAHEAKTGVDVYDSNYFNVVVRRHGRSNNFKSVLETIRDLIRAAQVVVPSWLHDVFLGYGDPAAAEYERMGKENLVRSIDFGDTFIDYQHLKSSFPEQVFGIVFDGRLSNRLMREAKYSKRIPVHRTF